MLTSLLFLSVCFLAYANGANDNFKGVASLFGSGILNYRQAVAWATLSTLAGSVAALFLAQTLLVKFSGKGLAPDALIHTLPFMIAVAGGAGATVILATRHGFPVSTTHALLGAMAGSTLLATSGAISLTPLLNNFVTPLLVSPVLALLLAGTLYWTVARWSLKRPVDDPMCLCLETADSQALMADNAGIVLDSARVPALSLDRQEACAERQAGMIFGFDMLKLRDGLHFCSAGAVCFARGLNDTPKIAALLLLAPNMTEQGIILAVGLAMMAGGVLNARKVADTMSYKITAISHDQGLSANLVTALLVIFASKLGMPVSTTHVSVGSLFGIGLVTGKANTQVIASIALSWLLTLPCAAVSGMVIYFIAAGN
ncbi:inorganic phosphate transporter [Methylomicrobium sp. RS1]|jgi:PiT family inorganic phosphate transporter|uniref:inorganic phosphate transporter n=1 Tax=Candidatus Methylomicrobium oryzae TaxID=2802053 RepID=UPI0019235503|nr:inorganic phosphate transporter [Methylomicrobium sp. RS1]MBL1262609.1 inorganic phosphate transporter [Methylomicrobium sp. RS1]